MSVNRIVARLRSARSSAGPAEAAHRLKVDRYPGCITHDPGVVPGWDLEDVSWADLELRAVGHLHSQMTLQRYPKVMVLTRFGTGDRLDVDGPAPTRLIRHPPDDDIVELHDVHLPVREAPNIGRVGEPPSLQSQEWSSAACLPPSGAIGKQPHYIEAELDSR